MLLVSAAEMRELDKMAQRRGIPALILIENAGRALADHAESLLAGMSPGALEDVWSAAVRERPGQGIRHKDARDQEPGTSQGHRGLGVVRTAETGFAPPGIWLQEGTR